MIQSMTGYGKKDVEGKRYRIVVEARSVNSRHLDLNLRLPPGGWALEPSIRKRIQQSCRRGRVEVQVRWEPLNPEDEPTVEIQVGKARAFRRALEELKSDLGIPGTVDLGMMAAFRDLLGVGEPSLEDESEALKAALSGALDELETMRREEGHAIGADLDARVRWLERQVQDVETLCPRVVEAQLGRWKERLHTLLGERSLDEGRLEQETVIWVDRLDVAEEIVRLKSHIAQFLRTMAEGMGAGKKLEFLLQEMHREVNTIGSKAMDAQIAHLVVEMKAQLERMREQVQNVE